MRRPAATRRPVLTPPDPGVLEPAEASDLDAQLRLEGLSLHDADLSDRDLTGLVLDECELVGAIAERTVLTHARLLTTRIERLTAPVLDAARSTWRDVEITGSRLGALDAFEAELRTVRLAGCKVDWLSLRGAVLEDVLLEDCTLEELDLTGATATRVALDRCRVGRIVLAGSRLQDVDLRGLEIGEIDDVSGLAGATLAPRQVAAMADAFAGQLGVRIEG